MTSGKDLGTYSCSDPEVAAEKPGTKPEHWDVYKLFIAPLYWDGGAEFPDGILFAPEIGGLPKPTGKAREFFTKGSQENIESLKEALPDVCSKEGQKTLADILIKSFNDHADDFTEYADANCQAIKTDENSVSDARSVLAEGAKAIIARIPEATKIEPDVRVVAAIAETVIAFLLDSNKGDTFI